MNYMSIRMGNGMMIHCVSVEGGGGEGGGACIMFLKVSGGFYL